MSFQCLFLSLSCYLAANSPGGLILEIFLLTEHHFRSIVCACARQSRHFS
jgi:hypothetical protein